MNHNAIPRKSPSNFASKSLFCGILVALSGVVVSIGACGPTETPKLCVFSPGKIGETTQLETYECPDDATAPSCDIRTSDEVFYIRHQLPEGVELPGPLEVRIQTPCSDEKVEVQHVGGIAFVQRKMPTGAACSMIVTAAIANSELRCSVHDSTAASCMDVCPNDIAMTPDGGP